MTLLGQRDLEKSLCFSLGLWLGWHSKLSNWVRGWGEHISQIACSDTHIVLSTEGLSYSLLASFITENLWPQPQPPPELPAYISNCLPNISSRTFYSCLKSHMSKTDFIIYALLLPTTSPYMSPSPILSLSVNDITGHSDIPMETLESPLTPPSPTSRSVSVNSDESFKSLSLPFVPLVGS